MYHKSKHSRVWWVAAASMALIGPLSGQARGYILWGDEHLDVDVPFPYGSLFLWDSSSVRILEHGRVDALLEAHNFSTVDISGGTAGGTLNAYDSSTVNISGSGEANYFYAHNSSTVNISGGRVDWLHVHDSNTVDISGGSVTGALKASGSSIVDIRGGTVDELHAYTNPPLSRFTVRRFRREAALPSTASASWVPGPWRASGPMDSRGLLTYRPIVLPRQSLPSPNPPPSPS